MSWEDLETAPAYEPEQAGVDLNLQVARTFATDEGKMVLAWFRDFYLEQPCWQPGADQSMGLFREGQNSVIRDIENRIRKARNNERSK
jgi:hypothetical protein